MPNFTEGCCQAVLLSAHSASMPLICNHRQELLQQPSTCKRADQCPTILRVHKQMQDIYRELSPKMFCRAFRMKYTVFNLLYTKIHNSFQAYAGNE